MEKSEGDELVRGILALIHGKNAIECSTAILIAYCEVCRALGLNSEQVVSSVRIFVEQNHAKFEVLQ